VVNDDLARCDTKAKLVGLLRMSKRSGKLPSSSNTDVGPDSQPNEGKILVGNDGYNESPVMYKRARAGIGYLASRSVFFGNLSVEERDIMAFWKMLKCQSEGRKGKSEI